MTPIRFGILCTGTSLPTWQARCVRELLTLPQVRPALLILDAGRREAPRPVRERLRAAMRHQQTLWFQYFQRIVQARSLAMRPVDLSAELAEVPRLSCQVERRGRCSEYFRPADVAAIRAHDLDFLLRFDFNIIRGEILTAARHGVWSYHHGDMDRYRGSPACLWEIYHGDPVTGATLQRLTERLDGGVILKRLAFPTAHESYVRNLDRVLLGSTGLPAQVVRDLREGKADYLDAPPSTSQAQVYRAPRNHQMMLLLARLAAAQVADAVLPFSRDRALTDVS